MSQKSNRKYSKIIRNRKQRIERRQGRKQWADQAEPMMRDSPLKAERVKLNRCHEYDLNPDG